MTLKVAPIRSTNVTVPEGPHGMIEATYDIPAEHNGAVALVAHCFTCNKNSPGVSRVSKTLARHGYASLRLTFSDLTLSHNVDDLHHVATWLSEKYTAPALLVGHSLGGAAALRAGSRIPSVKAVATIGAPFDPRHAAITLPDLIEQLAEASAGTYLDVPLSGRSIRITKEMLEDLARSVPARDIEALGRKKVNLMVAHSPFDQTVPFRDALKIIDAALQPASLIAVPEVDHLLTRRGSGQRVGELIAAWAQPYVT
ncbi:alpha/beta hydrolase family protein [Corynebacterium anserum]|uniref:Alpha/beta hydrolase n=1 Tax=Corynebacterium anserum TaxID=2684406 RepID=A0A7G7YN95_9CORY|nr:alpha/beta hydrolase [Corynebacterium anserum]MBC2681512.1 alpha/beta hydrolase [Corynebacterium anserum]QNH95965.1 alpha/beta hydrolase [Corynebacterium anserum]